MNTPLITWTCIVVLISTLFIVRLVVAWRTRHQTISRRHSKVVSIGREWEEIFVPGDRLIKNDYDYDEFDDM